MNQKAPPSDAPPFRPDTARLAVAGSRARHPGGAADREAAAGQLPGPRWRRFHPGQLPHRLRPCTLCGSADQLAGVGRRRRGLFAAVRAAPGLGRLAHRHARQMAGLVDRPRRVHPAAVPRRGWLDPAGRTKCRLPQRRLALADRAARPAGECLHLQRAGAGDRAAIVPADLHLRQRRARSDLLRNGGRGEHPRRRPMDHDAQGDAAAGLAVGRRQRDPGVPGSGGPVRPAGDHRHPGAHQCGRNATLAVLRISSARRGRSSVLHAVAADHARADHLTAAHAGPPRLRLAIRQGRRAAPDRARPLALAAVRLLRLRRTDRGGNANGGDCSRRPSPKPGATA